MINKMLVFIFWFFLILVSIIYYFIDIEFSNYFLMTGIIFILACTIFFLIRVEPVRPLRNQFLKHSTFAVIGLLVVNFQNYFDFLMQNIDETHLIMATNREAIVKSMIISIAGMLAFYISFLTKKNKIAHRATPVNFIGNSGVGLTILSSIMLFFYLFNVNKLYIFGGYGRFDMGITATYFSYLFRVSFFAIIIQKIINSNGINPSLFGWHDYFRYIGFMNILIMIIYLTTVVLSGDRGDLIGFGFLMLFGYIYTTKKKINIIQGLIILFLAATLITTLGIARSFNETNSDFFEKIQLSLNGDSNKAEHPSVIPATSELAGSVKALHYSVYNVPNYHDYLYTRFQVQALLSIIPFTGTIIEEIYDDSSMKYNSSDSFVTWLIQGDNPETGHGTSIVADFYLSFGFFGVVIGMMFYGWIIRYSELKMVERELFGIFSLILTIVLFSYSLYIARSSLFSIFRLVFWIWFLLYANSYAHVLMRRVR